VTFRRTHNRREQQVRDIEAVPQRGARQEAVVRDGHADYGRLTAALSARTEPVVTITWQELDGIVGGLPRSASDHFPQWWHGDRPHTRAWRRAGYELVKAEPGKLVTFRRVTATPPGTAARPPAPSPRPGGQGSQLPGDALAGIDPARVLLVVTCSGRKEPGGQPPGAVGPEPWPEDLRHARARVLAAAGADATRLLPAWRRYTGTFYQHAGPGLADAVATGHVAIISGGYGITRAGELIGYYDKELRLADWPADLLESALVGEAQRCAIHTVVAFASASTGYATLLRRTPWRQAGIRALLVTVIGVTDGAMSEVPRRLGQAFSVFWNQQHDEYPPGTTVQELS
jgi:hypothetical protein